MFPAASVAALSCAAGKGSMASGMMILLVCVVCGGGAGMNPLSPCSSPLSSAARSCEAQSMTSCVSDGTAQSPVSCSFEMSELSRLSKLSPSMTMGGFAASVMLQLLSRPTTWVMFRVAPVTAVAVLTCFQAAGSAHAFIYLSCRMTAGSWSRTSQLVKCCPGLMYGVELLQERKPLCQVM